MSHVSRHPVSTVYIESLGSLTRRLVNKPLEFLICLVQIVVDDDDVVNARRLGVLELLFRLVQPLLYAPLVLGAAPAQPPLEFLGGRRRDEDESRRDARLFDLLDAL